MYARVRDNFINQKSHQRKSTKGTKSVLLQVACIGWVLAQGLSEILLTVTGVSNGAEEPRHVGWELITFQDLALSAGES